MNRRAFLASGVSLFTPALLSAIEPIQRKGASRLVPGLAAYSFRDSMRWLRDGKPNPKLKEGEAGWEVFDFIDYCADQGGIGAELTSYFFPADVDEAYLLKVKRHAYLRGVPIAGTAVGNSFTLPPGEQRDKEIAYVKRWIDHAAVMGAPHIRVFAGSTPKGHTDEEAERFCLECYQECLEYAGRKGIFLGLENHGGIVAEPERLIRLVRAADSPWAGVNLDGGNFRTKDPYADLAKIAPYAVNVQVKMMIRAEGKPEGEPVDLPRLIQILRDANYQGWLTLEYEEAGNPADVVPGILEQIRALCP